MNSIGKTITKRQLQTTKMNEMEYMERLKDARTIQEVQTILWQRDMDIVDHGEMLP